MQRMSVDLPEPGRPDDDDDLLPADAQVDAAQGLEVAEELVDALDLDHLAAGPPWRRSSSSSLPTPSRRSSRWLSRDSV